MVAKEIRRLLRLMTAVVVVAATTGCTGGDKVGGDSSNAGKSAQPADSAAGAAAMLVAWPPNMGEKAKGVDECDFSLTSSNKCVGYYPADFSDPAQATILATWILALERNPQNWNELTDVSGNKKLVRRILDDETLGSSKRPKFGLSSIADARRIELNDFPQSSDKPGGLVMGRFSADPQEMDQRYGISDKRTKNMRSRFFYIVIDGYNRVNAEVNGGFQIATWRIYGVQKGAGSSPDRLVRIGNSAGAFRWCSMTHTIPEQGRGAQFNTCSGAYAVQTVSADSMVDSILSARDSSMGKTLLDAMKYEVGVLPALPLKASAEQVTSVLQKIFVGLPAAGPSSFSSVFTPDVLSALRFALDEPENPAWLACGIGCCTADW